MTETTDAVAFHLAMRVDPHDDTTRLVYADWLEENDNPKAAARLRWWVAARQAMREGVRWDTPADRGALANTIDTLKLQWVRQLYAVEIARIIRERYPLAKKWKKVAAASDDTLAVAERHALLLATKEKLSEAASAAWAAESAAAWAAESAAAESAAAWAAESAAATAAAAASTAAWAAAAAAWAVAAASAAKSAERSAVEAAARSAAATAAIALLAVPALKERPPTCGQAFVLWTDRNPEARP